MSWFSEIAERAEDLLNKVDKTAATALRNKTKFGSSSDIPVKVNFSHKSNVLFLDKNSFKQSSALSITNSISTVNLRSNQTKIQTTQRRQTETEDEKLLQFLNSSEPVLKTKEMVLEKKIIYPENSSEALFSQVREGEHFTETARVDERKVTSDIAVPSDPLAEKQLERTSPEILLDLSAEQKENPPVSVNTEEILHIYNNVDVAKLKEELLLASKRADHAQSEMKRMQKKLDHWNSQISGNDKLVRELQERDQDLKSVLDAKDSQLAVLKVRFEEADQELKNKRTIVDEIKIQNENMRKDHSEEILKYVQTCDAFKVKLSEAETELSKSKEVYRLTQTKSMLRMSKLEEEQKHLVENVTNYQRKWSELQERNKELMSQLHCSTCNLESLHHEYADYKQRAQRILQSKEKTIDDLKRGNFGIEESNTGESSYTVLNAEVEGIKQERDLLREELCRANKDIKTLHSEIQDLERLSQTDNNTAREHCKNMEEQLHQERLLTEEIQLLNTHLKKEIQFSIEEMHRAKHNLQSRIQDREMEIEKLHKQLTAKSMSTISQDELESRLHALTENLIQKQTVVEALSTEKNSLVLQLERLEQQLKEAQHYGTHLHTAVGLNSSVKDMKQKSTVILENPFDSTLTRKVKKMYGGIDAFSIRMGVFFRRYPIARVFMIIYMLLLHFWVMIVLLTYEPEIHNTTYKSVDNESI